MKLINILVCGAALILSGCAKLQVSVDVLDPEVVNVRVDQDLINDAMKKISSQNEQSVGLMFVSYKNDHYKAYTSTASKMKDEAKKEADSTKKKLLIKSADDWLAGYKLKIDAEYNKKELTWLASVNNVNKLYGEYIAAKAKEDSLKSKDVLNSKEKLQIQRSANLTSQLRSRLLIAIKAYDEGVKNLQKFIDHDLNQNSSISEEDRNKAIQATNARSKSLFDDGGFQHSKYSYYVVNATDEEWAEYYDRSFGSGYMGDLDIAIKAVGASNFTVKGLSFNPSDVANTAAKVTTQSLLIAAQMAGVPVNIKGTPQGAGSSLATSSTRISLARSNQAQLEIQIDSQHDALLKIAQAIVDEEKNVTGGDNARLAAISSIKAIYDSQSSRLNITPSVSGSGE